jgi:hypothetical protein
MSGNSCNLRLTFDSLGKYQKRAKKYGGKGNDPTKKKEYA